MALALHSCHRSPGAPGTLAAACGLFLPVQSRPSSARAARPRAECVRVRGTRFASTARFDPKFCPYEALDLPKSASQDEIKKAFYKLAMEHHPDRALAQGASKSSKDRFVRINRAYELLGTPQKRSQYDRERSLWLNNTNRVGPHHQHHPFGYPAGRAYQSQYYDPFHGVPRAARDSWGGPHPGYAYAGATYARSPDATRLWVLLGVFFIAGSAISVFHVTRLREVVAQSMNLKEREALVYYNESRKRATEGRKGLGEDVLETARRRRRPEQPNTQAETATPPE